MLKERTDPNRYCLRKISGIICIASGVIIIFSKLIYFYSTGNTPMLEGRGQFLVATGATLLSITGFDPIVERVSTKDKKNNS